MKFTEKELRILHYGIYRLIEDYESSSKKELDEYEDLLAKVDTYLDEVNEPIDEERLEKLAFHSEKETFKEQDIPFQTKWVEGFKAGYCKAMEE